MNSALLMQDIVSGLISIRSVILVDKSVAPVLHYDNEADYERIMHATNILMSLGIITGTHHDSDMRELYVVHGAAPGEIDRVVEQFIVIHGTFLASFYEKKPFEIECFDDIERRQFMDILMALCSRHKIFDSFSFDTKSMKLTAQLKGST